MRWSGVGVAAAVSALVLSGCGGEVGVGIEGPVDVVTSATSDAAAALTAALAEPVTSTSAAPDQASEGASPSASATPSGAPEVVADAPPKDTRDTLTVWVLPETSDSILDQVGKVFAKEYPKVDLNVVRQDWATVSAMLQDKLPTPETPDVVEIANTQTAGLAGQGLIADLEPARSRLKVSDWTPALTGSTTVDDRLMSVPMYGFGRLVAYDPQAWKAAGVTAPPRSMGEFTDALERVQSAGVSTDYSALWFPGRYWQGSLPWIWEEGGEIAEQQQGVWTGTVDSGESQAGLTQLQDIARRFSRAPVDADETTAGQVKAFDEGRASAALMLPYEIAALTKDHEVFPLPGIAKDSVAPQLIQGSDLAVSAASSRQGLAVAWLEAFLDPDIQKQFAKSSGYLPALASAVSAMKGDPVTEAEARLADKGRFTPNAPQWVDAEQQEILPNMLQTILTPSPSATASGSMSPSVAGSAFPSSTSPAPGAGEGGPLPSQLTPSG